MAIRAAIQMAQARKDEMFEKPVIIHTISVANREVPHFRLIAAAGGGAHLRVTQAGRLVDELVLLAFGAEFRDRIRAWMSEMDRLRTAK